MTLKYETGQKARDDPGENYNGAIIGAHLNFRWALRHGIVKIMLKTMGHWKTPMGHFEKKIMDHTSLLMMVGKV